MGDEKAKRDEKAGLEDWTLGELIQYSLPDDPAHMRAPDKINFGGIEYLPAASFGTYKPPSVSITGGTYAGLGTRALTPEEACESYVDDALYNLECAVEELPDGPAKAHLRAVLELLGEWTEMLR